VLQSNQIIVRKTYWVHSKEKYFKRRACEVVNAQGERGDLVFLQYFFAGDPRPIKVASHGNSKVHQRPFIPTAPSTKEIIRNKTLNSAAGPSKIFDATFEMQGGMKSMSAVSDVPRDSRQVQYIRTKIRNPKKNDELALLINKAQESSFVHSLQVSPGLRLVITTEEQIDDLKKFCCDPLSFSILGIDTTYNISKSSYLTPTTYKHLKLIDNRTGNHPNMPGPALTHPQQVGCLDLPIFWKYTFRD